MADEVSTASEQTFMQVQFDNKIAKDTLLTILNESKNPIIAFKSNRAYTILTISSPKLQNGEHYIYEGGSIEGTNENGLYIDITSYTAGNIRGYRDASNMMKAGDFKPIEIDNQKEDRSELHFYIMLSLGTVLIILVILTILLVKLKKVNIKGNLIILIIGMVLGTMISLETIYQIYNRKMENNGEQQTQFGIQGKPDDMPMKEQNSRNPQEKTNV